MNITNKTTRTFTISGITEQQAQDMLNMSVQISDDAHRTDGELETLNNLRQAFLAAGLTTTKGEHAN